MTFSRKQKLSLAGIAVAVMFVAPMPILGTSYYLHIPAYLSFIIPEGEEAQLQNWNPDPVAKGNTLLFEPQYGTHPYHLPLVTKLGYALDTDSAKTIRKVAPGTDRDYVLKAFRDGTLSPVGKPAPDFDLITTDGQRVRLADLRGKIVAFQFAAMTCPPARSSVQTWTELYDSKYKENEDVVMLTVYSRERHPGESPAFAEFRHARTFTEKVEYASELADMSSIPVAVDSLSEDVLGQYGGDLPNAAFVIDKEGILVFKSEWSNPSQVEYVIDTLLDHYDGLETKRPSEDSRLSSI